MAVKALKIHLLDGLTPAFPCNSALGGTLGLGSVVDSGLVVTQC